MKAFYFFLASVFILVEGVSLPVAQADVIGVTQERLWSYLTLFEEAHLDTIKNSTTYRVVQNQLTSVNSPNITIHFEVETTNKNNIPITYIAQFEVEDRNCGDLGQPGCQIRRFEIFRKTAPSPLVRPQVGSSVPLLREVFTRSLLKQESFIRVLAEMAKENPSYFRELKAELAAILKWEELSSPLIDARGLLAKILCAGVTFDQLFTALSRTHLHDSSPVQRTPELVKILEEIILAAH